MICGPSSTLHEITYADMPLGILCSSVPNTSDGSLSPRYHLTVSCVSGLITRMSILAMCASPAFFCDSRDLSFTVCHRKIYQLHLSEIFTCLWTLDRFSGMNPAGNSWGSISSWYLFQVPASLGWRDWYSYFVRYAEYSWGLIQLQILH